MTRIVDEWHIDIHQSVGMYIIIGYDGHIEISERWRRKFALTGKDCDPDTLAEDGSYFCSGSYYFDQTGY